MVELFDLHADIGYDLWVEKQEGVEDPFAAHEKKLKEGGIAYTSIACFFDGHQTWEEMQAMILNANEQLSKHNVLQVKGCGHQTRDGRLVTFLTVEGMCGIKDQVAQKIEWMAQQGVRIASLTWNDENALATGVKGTVTRGVTPLGIEAMQAMAEHRMLLDVSHLNEASFWDVIRLYQGKLLATHSNARRLCENARNLTDQQIQAIAARQGLIGLNAAKQFVSINPAKQTAYQLAMHGKYIRDLVGLNVLALGFDFMDYLKGMEDAMVEGLPNAAYAQNMVTALAEVGFDQEEIIAIGHGNALRFMHRN